MKPRHWFVKIPQAKLELLRKLVACRFRHSGRILIHRIEKNHVIKAESLCVQSPDHMSEDVKERLLEFIAGFIEGAELESSTKELES